jgi:hypothetical protein
MRLPVAGALFLALAGGLWWTASLAGEGGAGTATATGSFPVFVVGPQGESLANGTVVSQGTPLAALQALSAQQGFLVETEEQTWIGDGCTATYVVGIAGQRETTSGGWNYYTRRPGGPWAWGPAGAACHRLSAGDEVEWCWVEADVCGHHTP